MFIINDFYIVEFLLTSNNEDDSYILNGIIECYWKGSSVQGILDFRMVYPGQEIVFNIRGQKAQVGVSKEIAEYLKNMMLQHKENC